MLKFSVMFAFSCHRPECVLMSFLPLTQEYYFLLKGNYLGSIPTEDTPQTKFEAMQIGTEKSNI